MQYSGVPLFTWADCTCTFVNAIIKNQITMSKQLFEKYKEEYIASLPKGAEVNEDAMQDYIEMCIQEYEDRFRYEDGDHYEEREPRMPEENYPY